MSKAIVNTFKKLDTDTSQNKRDNSSFYDGQNLRLISDEALSNGALINYRGTKAKIDLGVVNNDTTVSIVGYSEVGDSLILLMSTVYNDSNIEARSIVSSIAKVSISNTDDIQSITTIYSDDDSVEKLDFPTYSQQSIDSGGSNTSAIDSINGGDSDDVQSVVLSAGNSSIYLFTSNTQIECVGRYETGNSQKIYFAVPGKPLRAYNVAGNTSAPYVQAQFLDIIPANESVSFSNLSISGGGSLESGNIQYTYRLFNKYGSETTFGTCSEMISITSYDANGTSEFRGSDIEVNTGKSVSMSIDVSEVENFSYIKIYSIHYKVKDVPTITLISEKEIIGDSIVHTDNGSSLGTITVKEFNLFGGSLIGAETIEVKNNILFAGNVHEIEDTISDEDLDCRAYRFRDKIVFATSVPFTIDDRYDNVLEIITPSPIESYVYYGDGTVEQVLKRFILLSLDSGQQLTAFLDRQTGPNYYILKTLGYSGAPSSGQILDLIVPTSIVFESDNTCYGIMNTGNYFHFSISGDEYNVLSSGTDFNIPINADCINKYNNEFEVPDGSSIHPFNYQLDINGNNGGTGKIVSYKFVTDDYVELCSGFNTFVNQSNVDFILKKKSFKRGETYRIGITPYDLKGRPYFTKWVGDIRIPYEAVFSGDELKTQSIKARNVYIEFKINTANISEETLSKISGFQISSVARDSINRSIIAQGVSMLNIKSYETTGLTDSYCPSMHASNVYANNPVNVTANQSIPTGSGNDSSVITALSSPEFSMNGGISIVNGSKRAKVVAAYPTVLHKTSTSIYTERSVINHVTMSGASGNKTRIISPASYMDKFGPNSHTFSPNDGSFSRISKVGSTYTYFNESFKRNGSSINIDDFVVARPAEDSSVKFQLKNTNTAYYPENIILCNRFSSSKKITRFDYATNMMFISTYEPLRKLYVDVNDGTEIVMSYAPAAGMSYVIDIYTDNSESIYGGITHASRSLNSYQACSELYPVVDGVITINAYGDSFNTVYDTMLSVVDPKNDDSTDGTVDRMQVAALIPIESSINCMLSDMKPSKYVLNASYSGGANQLDTVIGITETQLKGIELWSDKYPDIGDSIKYNTAYSSTSKYPQFFPEPLLFDSISNNNYMVAASDVKVNGEFIDSWTKFKIADKFEVDSKYGPIHKLTTLDNKLYCFQEDAISVLSVLDRAVSTSNIGEIVLGSGKVLDRYDYVKYGSGILKPSHIINNLNSIYYIDGNRMALDMLRADKTQLSVEKGVNSLVRSLYKGIDTNVAFGYNPKYKEVMITIGNKTLVFNEVIGEFQPLSSTVPLIFINTTNNLYSFIRTNIISGLLSNYIYKHDAGSYGETYSEAMLNGLSSNIQPSYVSFIVGSGSTAILVFDNIEFRTEVRPDGDNISIFNDSDTYDTVDTIEFKNSYQSSIRNVLVKDVDLRPNTSRRMRSWTTAVPLTTNGKRLVDTFLSVKMQFNNNGTDVFKLHDNITYVRPTHK